MNQYDCPDCGKQYTRKSTYANKRCQSCEMYFRLGGEINSLPEKGEVALDSRGYPICHICGRAYRKLATHIAQKHKMSAQDYKKEFGLNKRKGITSEQYKKKMRNHIIGNYKKVVAINLTQKGIKNRFKPGHAGRTRDLVSLQELKRLQKGIIRNEKK